MPRLQFLRYVLRHTATYNSAWRLYRLARKHQSLEKTDQVEVFKIEDNGRTLQIGLRPGTTDIGNFHEVFFKRQYECELTSDPAVIFDVGGNIGLSAIWFATRYPGSLIHVFEPLSSNYTVLIENIRRNGLDDRIIAHPHAIGPEDATIPLYKDPSDTLWGYTLYQPRDERTGQPAAVAEIVKVRKLSNVLEELGQPSIDYLKLDCEGAELDILRDLKDRLSQISTVIGEIHYSLCDGLECLRLLSKTHHVKWDKLLDADCGSFVATRDS